MEFNIDTTGDTNNIDEKNEDNVEFYIDSAPSSDKNDSKTDRNLLLEDLFKDFDHILAKPVKHKKTITPKNPLLAKVLGDLGVNEDGTLKRRKTKSRNILLLEHERKNVKKALEKSVIVPEFEKLNVVPPIEISEKKLKQERKKQRELTKGNKWYGLPATELTDEIKRDLEVLQMRSVLDPKRFYKKNDLKVLPKYFQIGTVVDSPLDFYNNRIPKKQRKKTLVDELLADAEFNKYNKRKYKEIIEDKQKTHYKAWRQAKKLKKNK